MRAAPLSEKPQFKIFTDVRPEQRIIGLARELTRHLNLQSLPGEYWVYLLGVLELIVMVWLLHAVDGPIKASDRWRYWLWLLAPWGLVGLMFLCWRRLADTAASPPVGLVPDRGNADDQARGRDNAIVGPEHRGSQPPNAADEVVLRV